MEFTREDIEKVYDELDRRMEIDIRDEAIPWNGDSIREERASRLQGVYGTIMALAPDKNWQEVVRWFGEIEEERYGGMR